jgi:hypothetical protein
VHDALAVRVRQTIRDVTKEAHSLPKRQFPLSCHKRAQGFAANEGHRIVQKVAGEPGAQQRNDVRMLELRRQLNLASKALEADARREFGGQHFDDDLPAETDIFGEEYP